MKKVVLLALVFATLTSVAIFYTLRPATGNVLIATHGSNSTTGGGKRTPALDFEWKLGNPYVLQNGNGEVFLDLRVKGNAATQTERKRLNLVLVIDRSGSMASENKLEQVKNAAVNILDQMDPRDRLGLVIYDDNVQTILPSSPVENRARVREMIYSLRPGGGTNLCGGMLQGFDQVKSAFDRGSVNRIVLLSDGLANVGISDPKQIAEHARIIRDHSVSVSTMGVGLDYNENLMANIADSSGGNYYYVSNDTNMAEIFRREWNLMQAVVASDVRASFDLADGVEVSDVPGFQWTMEGRQLLIQLPDIYSGESKRVLVEFKAPAQRPARLVLGKGRLQYTDLMGKSPQVARLTFEPSVRVVNDANMVKNNLDRDVHSKVVSVQASKTMDEAYDRFQSGDAEGAYRVAKETVQKLRALGYVETEEQAGRYEKNLQVLQPSAAPAPDSAAGKDFLKRQKAQERKTKQNTPQ